MHIDGSSTQVLRQPPAPSADARSGPLSDLRVLDCSNVIAGPTACQILADFGADVIKVEHPAGDSLRSHPPFVNGVSLWWKQVSRNKRCVAIDLSNPDGAALLTRLAGTADVLVESFRPGTLERWGIDVDAIVSGPRPLVVVRLSGFGQLGPYARRPGFGTLVEAMSGFAALSGEADGPPTLPPFGLADNVAALATVGAIMMAIHRRTQTGTGEIVDLSILEPIMSALGPQIPMADLLGRTTSRRGNQSEYNAPRNLYKSSDGRWIAISASTVRVADRLMCLVGRPELVAEPWFASAAGRVAHSKEIDQPIATWIAQRDRAGALDELERAEVAAAPVYDTSELLDDPHVNAAEMVVTVADDECGPMKMQNVLFRLSGGGGRIRHAGRSLGADTDEVLGDELGIPGDELDRLRQRAVIA